MKNLLVKVRLLIQRMWEMTKQKTKKLIKKLGKINEETIDFATELDYYGGLNANQELIAKIMVLSTLIKIQCEEIKCTMTT